MTRLNIRELEIRDVDEATVLSRMRDASEFVMIVGWNADFLLLCSDGSVLAFWAGSDYGPSYWQLGEPERQLTEDI